MDEVAFFCFLDESPEDLSYMPFVQSQLQSAHNLSGKGYVGNILIHYLASQSKACHYIDFRRSEVFTNMSIDFLQLADVFA
jgi:hypothetical protein